MKYAPVRSGEFSTFWGRDEHRARRAMSPTSRTSTAAFSPTPSTEVSSSGAAWSTPWQRAEALDEPVGRFVGVLPWNGVEQQQLQQLVILHPLCAQRQVPALAALAMPSCRPMMTPPLLRLKL